MSENFAGWAGDEATPVAEAPPAVSGDMLARLPRRFARQIAQAEARERAEAKRAADEKATAAEAWHAQNLEMYRSQAERRGEDVSVMELLQGGGGRTVEDVLADARGDLERDYKPQQPVDARFYSEPVIHASRSDWWPESEFQLDRMLERMQDDHTWFVMYRQRHASRQGRGDEHLAAMRADSRGARR